MDFTRQIETNRRILINDILRRLDAALGPFRTALDTFLATLFQARLPADWRRQWHTFVATQATAGFAVEPHSIREMEQWIEAWARFCDLLPVTSGQSGTHELGAQLAVDATVTDVDERPHEWPQRSEAQFTLVGYPTGSRRQPPRGSANRRVVAHGSPRSTASAGITTKSRLPADSRGTWVKGTKGNGVFRYNNSLENRQAGIAGKEVRFRNQYIAVGGFPAEAYYRGSAAKASVKIETLTGTNADSSAADAAMRKKLRNPRWRRPALYRWNHAGPPGSKVMELVDVRYHKSIAHKGPAAEPRAARRAVKARGRKAKRSIGRKGARQAVRGKAATGRAMGALTIYLTARDALQAAGILQPDVYVVEWEDYYFVAKDGSVFIVHTSGWFTSGKLTFVAGPRKGQTLRLTDAQVDKYHKQAEAVWGKFIPGTRLSPARFIPGTKRKRFPLTRTKYGVPQEIGWIDEKGVHYYSVPKPTVI